MIYLLFLFVNPSDLAPPRRGANKICCHASKTGLVICSFLGSHMFLEDVHIPSSTPRTKNSCVAPPVRIKKESFIPLVLLLPHGWISMDILSEKALYLGE